MGDPQAMRAAPNLLPRPPPHDEFPSRIGRIDLFRRMNLPAQLLLGSDCG